MKLFPFCMLAVAAIAGAASAAAQTVGAVHGNIFFCDGAGNSQQLTASRRDGSPKLSPDGRQVAFVRTVPGEKIWTPIEDADPQEIWIVDIDGRRQHRLVSSVVTPEPSTGYPNSSNLKFSSDGRDLFFLTICAAVSSCVHKVDVRTRATRLLGGANAYALVRGGRYDGYLLVQQHRYHRGGGSYEDVWLMRHDGRVIRNVGPGDQQFDETVRRFEVATGGKAHFPNSALQPTRACGPRG